MQPVIVSMLNLHTLPVDQVAEDMTHLEVLLTFRLVQSPQSLRAAGLTLHKLYAGFVL